MIQRSKIPFALGTINILQCVYLNLFDYMPVIYIYRSKSCSNNFTNDSRGGCMDGYTEREYFFAL